MSETPQTPPPSEPVPPGGSTSGFNTDQMKSAVQGASPYDLAIVGAGVLAFIFSLFNYYTVSYTGRVLGVTATASGSASAWHGFFGWFAALVALAVSVIVGMRLLGLRVLDSAMTRMVAMVGFAVATVCVVLALFVWPGKVDLPGVDYGHGIGYWLSLIVIVGGLVLSVMRRDAEV